MQTDLILGAIMVVMTILGGIVSAHGPKDNRHKIAYVIAFVILGIAAFAFILLQSKESARAEGELKHQLTQLTAASSETNRLQRLNNDLQNQALTLSRTNEVLTRQAIASVTGGDNYCWMDFFFQFNPPVPVFVNAGRYSLFDVTLTIADSTKLAQRISRHEPMLMDNINLNLGVLQVGARIGSPIPFSSDIAQDFVIFFQGRNGTWTEKLVLRKVNGVWSDALQVWYVPAGSTKASKKPIFEKRAGNFPPGKIEWPK